eukprot:g2041.t1
MDAIANNDIERFISETNCTPETARFFLEMTNGNYEQALMRYRETESQTGGVDRNPRGGQPAIRDAALQGGPLIGAVRFFSGVLSLPIALLKASFQICRVIIEFSLTTTAQVILPPGIHDRFIATNGVPDPVLQAADFVRSFRNCYGTEYPNFFEMGWKEAARAAENQSKLLFAYIHSPEHEDTDEFCQQVLASSDVIAFLNQHFICWGGSIDRSPAFVLATNLGATTYPFMCLLTSTPTQTTMVASIQGTITGSELINILQQALDEQGAMMMERRAERQRRETDRQIIADQDLEYQRALEADRERDRQNQEAEARAAAEEEANRRRLEQERLIKERELEAKFTREENVKQRRFEKSSTLAAEPESGTGVVQVRVRLPDGSTHNRKFLESSKISEIYDYVDSLESLSCWDYVLVCSFPRFEFGSDKRLKSLGELGIDHSVMLLVQSHDD